jgi:hypothetical protein
LNFIGRILGRLIHDKTSDYRALVEQSREELRLKDKLNDEAWGGGGDDYAVNPKLGLVAFTGPDGLTATGHFQYVGSFNSHDATWLWAWANSTMQPELTKDAQSVRSYGQDRGFERLTTAKFESTEAEAWELTALSCKICDAQGAYRAAFGELLIFITFRDVVVGEMPESLKMPSAAELRKRASSREAAEELAREGLLERVLLVPVELGGVDSSLNMIYLPKGAAAYKRQIDEFIGGLVAEGKITKYYANVKHDDTSFIPSKIIIRGSGPEPFRQAIDVDAFL